MKAFSRSCVTAIACLLLLPGCGDDGGQDDGDTMADPDALDGTSLLRAIYEAIPDGWTLP